MNREEVALALRPRVRRALGRGPRGAWLFNVAQGLASPTRAAVPVGWRRKAELLRDGFLPVSHVLYDLEANDPRDYLSDRERELTQRVNGPLGTLLEDKVAFFLALSRLGVPTPEVLAVMVEGRLHGIDGPFDLRERLAAGRLVVKPARGGGTFGVLVLEDGPRVDGTPTSWGALEQWLSSLHDHVVTRYVEQAEYARSIFGGAANTIRVLTLVSDGEPLIATAVHRFGTSRTAPVDSWLRGGFSARVDLESGVLGPAVAYPRDGVLVWGGRHPETGAQIADVAVPGWPAVRDAVIALARRLAFLPYVGWDVVVTEDGPVVLEGNRYTGVQLLQVHGGLLRDPAVRAFYARHGVIRRRAATEPWR